VELGEEAGEGFLAQVFWAVATGDVSPDDARDQGEQMIHERTGSAFIPMFQPPADEVGGIGRHGVPEAGTLGG
jgi:hypothetical protein